MSGGEGTGDRGAERGREAPSIAADAGAAAADAAVAAAAAPLQKHSLHGESAARRQAASELLFFAGVGDLARCRQIAEDWRLDPGATGDYDRRTPLHLAAAEGAYSVVRWLLEDVGAPPNPVDRFSRTPLEEAALGDHGEVVALLQRFGGKVVAASADDSASPSQKKADATAAAPSSPPTAEARLVPLEQSRLAGAVRIFGARTAAAAHAGPEATAEDLLLARDGGAESDERAAEAAAASKARAKAAAAAAAKTSSAASALATERSKSSSSLLELLTTPEWEINPSHLRIGPAVGEGEFGTVHASTWHGAPVAVKILKSSDDVALGDFRTELNVLQKVHHPHTVQFYGAITRSRPLMLVTELVSGGSVADLLRASRSGRAPHPSFARAAQLALDTSRGLLYLHSRQAHVVIHRDLKPGNLLISLGARLPSGIDSRKAAASYGLAKISDFGLSKSLAMRTGADAGVGIGGGGGAAMSTSASAATLATLAEEEDVGPGGGYEEGGDDGEDEGDRKKRGWLSNRGERSASKRGESSGGSTKKPSYAKDDEASTYRLTGETGSYRYMAPEVFRHERYNSKVDVYSFGIILFELLDGGVPFGKKVHPLDAARRAALLHARPGWGMGATSKGLRRAPRPPPPASLRSLVEDCWKPDPAQRPDFSEICQRLEAALAELPPDMATPTRLLSDGSGGRRKGCVVQ